MGVLGIVTGLFEFKNYKNNKIYLAIIGLILIISLILGYIKITSPLYSGNIQFNYILAILFILFTITVTYDFTHDYKLSKMQLKDKRPLIRYGVPIIGSIITLCIIIWLAYNLII
jgi:amino acid transporter